MKKIALITICAAAALLVVACGGNKKGKKAETAAQEVVEEALQEAFSGKHASEDAATFYTKANYGMSLKDLKPDMDLEAPGEKAFYGNEDLIVATFTKKEGAISKEDYIAYVGKVFEATRKAADNGINIYGFEEKETKEEAMAEKTLETVIDQGKGLKIFGQEIYMGEYAWSFLKGGAPMRCELKWLEKSVDGNDVPYAIKLKIEKGMLKSLGDLMKEADSLLSDPENQKKLEEALSQLEK